MAAEDQDLWEQRLRDGYDAFNRGAFEEAGKHLHPDIVWHRPMQIEGAVEGADGVRRHMEPDAFSSQRIEIHSMEAVGECVLVDCTFHAVGASSGLPFSQEVFHLWRIRDELAVEFNGFFDRDEAVAALEEGTA